MLKHDETKKEKEKQNFYHSVCVVFGECVQL